MEDLEALILDSLVTEPSDVFSDEFEVTLIDVHGVGEVILFDVLLRVANELANSLDARRGLVVLELDVLIQHLDQTVRAAHTNRLEDAN